MIRNTFASVCNRLTLDAEGCWMWTGGNRNGYGSVRINGADVLVYRYVYEKLVGPIPDGLVIDHLCRKPPCCNPAHLEPVTNAENILRGISFAANNARKTHCRQGHELAADNLCKYEITRGARLCVQCRNVRQAKELVGEVGVATRARRRARAAERRARRIEVVGAKDGE